jgi:HEAT repeat protein
MLNELRSVGVDVDSVWRLVNTREPYPEAIPVLLSWLDRVDVEVQADARRRDRMLEGIVRALTVKEAKGVAAMPLVRLMNDRRESSASLQWAIGNALSQVADATVYSELVELVRDAGLGRSRQMLADALVRTKNPEVFDVLVGLVDDDDLTSHILSALRRIDILRARPYFERYAEDDRPLVRRKAQQALKRADSIEGGN